MSLAAFFGAAAAAVAHADFEAGLAGFREGDPPELLDSLRQGLQETSSGVGAPRV